MLIIENATDFSSFIKDLLLRSMNESNRYFFFLLLSSSMISKERYLAIAKSNSISSMCCFSFLSLIWLYIHRHLQNNKITVEWGLTSNIRRHRILNQHVVTIIYYIFRLDLNILHRQVHRHHQPILPLLNILSILLVYVRYYHRNIKNKLIRIEIKTKIMTSLGSSTEIRRWISTIYSDLSRNYYPFGKIRIIIIWCWTCCWFDQDFGSYKTNNQMKNFHFLFIASSRWITKCSNSTWWIT